MNAFDAFVTKVNQDGTALIYSTYLGGNENDSAIAVAVDASGAAYVTGQSDSTNFPGTAGVIQPTKKSGGADAFVAKLSADGSSLTYFTYLGGSNYDGGSDIAIDGSGNAYVSGATSSSDFPTTPGAFQTV